MIVSERQLAVAERELSKLKSALAEIAEKPNSDKAWLTELENAALESQIAEIEVEIQEYRMLRDGQITFSERYSLSDLPRILIQARIAQGLSQTDLSTRLGMKPQQIQRYEASDYMGASLARLIEISEVLGVRISESFSLPTNGTGSILAWSGLDDVAWDRFPGDEMIRRGWIQPQLGESLADAVQGYFERVAGSSFATALHRKKLRGQNLPDEAALLAWQARVLDLAEKRIAEANVREFELDDSWISDLSKLSILIDGPAAARSFLESRGILLVIEPQLQGTYLDGAAMLSPSGRPIVALTLRFDRLDNFWFVLAHELGHIFLHLHENVRLDFFDEEGPIGTDTLEEEANEFALNMLIPNEEWVKCLSRFALTSDSVKLDADRLSIHPSIIAGRIRRERDDYTIFSELIGQGEVHRHFEEVKI